LHRNSEGRTIIDVVVACVDHALKYQVSDCGAQGVAAPGRHDGVALRYQMGRNAHEGPGRDLLDDPRVAELYLGAAPSTNIEDAL
jgi:hypothetical protein